MNYQYVLQKIDLMKAINMQLKRKQIKEVKYNPNIHNTLYNKGMKKKEKVYTNKELKDIAKMDQCYFSNKK